MKTIAAAVADDPERQTFGAVLAVWSSTIGKDEVTAAELEARANERNSDDSSANKDLRNALLAVAAGKGGEISAHRLGNWLRTATACSAGAA